MEKIYTYIDKKKLFDIGVNVNDLKHDTPLLKNLIYAPLRNPWTSFWVIAGIAAAFVLGLLFCKGRLTCCTRKTIIDPFAGLKNLEGLRERQTMLRNRGLNQNDESEEKENIETVSQGDIIEKQQTNNQDKRKSETVGKTALESKKTEINPQWNKSSGITILW